MKVIGKIVYIIIEVIFTLATLGVGAVTAYSQSLYSQAVNSDSPLIEYGGKLYDQAELVDKFAADRDMMVKCFVVILVITVVLYAVGIVRSRKRKMAGK